MNSGLKVRVFDRLSAAVAIVASTGLVLMTLIIAWQVIGRYVLNNSPVWAESSALILMLYFVLLAAAVGVYEQSHLGLRFLVLRLPARPRKFVYALGQSLVAVFGLAMAWNGVTLVRFTATHVIPTLDISRSIAYWPFVICGVLIAVFAAFRCVHALSSEGPADPWS